MRLIYGKKSGYSLVELLVVIAVLSILMTVAVLAIQGTIYQSQLNGRISADLQGINNALLQYRKDHGEFPVPPVGTDYNVSCFKADASYAHDCASAAFMNAQIDSNLLPVKYLSEIPIDPRTGGRYVYGVTPSDGAYYQIAAAFDNEARVVGNLGKGFYLPSIIRAYDSSQFVIHRGTAMPYDPEKRFLATARNVVGTIAVSGLALSLQDGDTLEKGQTITTEAGEEADLYFPDGSITHIDPSTTLELKQMDLVENDKDSIATKILIRLEAGNIWNKVVRLASKSEFQVESTGVVAGVRGTEFGVEINGNDSKYYVLSGEVGVKTSVSDAQNVDIRGVTEEDLTGKITVPQNGAAQVATVSQGASIITSSDAIGTDLEYMKEKAQPALMPSLIPYIRGFTANFVSGISGAQYTLEVIFAGMVIPEDGSAPYDLDGFEVYRAEATGGREILAEALDTVPQVLSNADVFFWDSQKEAYVLTYLQETTAPILLRGFSGNAPTVFSDVSWPPLVLSGESPQNGEVVVSLEDQYPELVSVLKTELVPSLAVSSPKNYYKVSTPVSLLLSDIELSQLVVTQNDTSVSNLLTLDANSSPQFQVTAPGVYQIVSTANNDIFITLNVCSYTGTIEGSECWVLGDSNQNCTNACSTKVGLTCVIDNAVTTSINEGDWNSTASVCTNLGASYTTTLPSNDASNSFAPYLAGTLCRLRSTTLDVGIPAFSCGTTPDTGILRICSCK